MTWLKRLFSRARRERELDEEVRVHLEMEAEKNRAAGMSPDDARLAALRSFGSVAEVKDEVRESWGARLLDDLRADVRVGVRSLLRDRAFSLVVIITLALGVGANTAIFSVVNGVLLRPLPYAGGDRIVHFVQAVPHPDDHHGGFSPPETRDLREQSQLFEGIAEFHTMWFNLLGRGEPQRVQTGVVSSNFFSVFGVTPILGRDLVAADERPGAPAVLLLSHSFWQRAYGGDPGIVGQTFEMNDRPHMVVGVLPPIPLYPNDNDVYMPTSACPFRSAPATENGRGARMTQVFARLRDGVDLDQARAELAVVVGRMREAHPGDYQDADRLRIEPVPVREELTRDWRLRLWLLLGVAAGVLLIVCANIANLTLARSLRRAREMAVRSALGAGRTRLLRHLLTEGLLLSLVGGVLGLAAAWVGHGFLVEYMGRFSPRAAEIRIDGVVIAFTLAISVATGLVFAAVPALPGRRDVAGALRDAGKHGGARARTRLRAALVVVQVAFSTVLLVGAGLALRSLARLESVDPGFRADGVLTMRVDLDWAHYRGPEQADARTAAYGRILDRVRAVPGVTLASVATTFPLSQVDPFSGLYEIEGRPPATPAARPRADTRTASTGYLETIGIPIVAGRAFEERDDGKAQRVVIVNQALARRQFPGEEAVGRRISFDGRETWRTIVGVAADSRQYGLDRDAREEIYVPLRQSAPIAAALLVKVQGDPRGMAPLVRAAVHEVDPRQPVAQLRTFQEVLSSSLSTPRATTAVLALFALLALAVTAAGVGGLLAVTVSQRSQEIAVRIALGAQRRDVLSLILRQGLGLVLAGVAIGAGGGVAVGRVMASFLYRVAPTDPLIFASVVAVLLAVAAMACLLPARRAAGIDPMNALRAG
jgi:predicted permease